MIKKSNDVSIKDALSQMLDTYHIRQRYDQKSIVSVWPMIVGVPIANRTQEVYIANQKLFVKTESSTVRHELNLMREGIVARINEQAGYELINEIILS